MTRTVSIITPENIEVTYELAGVASRFMATLVDIIIQVLMIALIYGVVRLAGGAEAVSGIGISSIASAAGTIVVFLVMYFYALLFEAFWAGRTPGKRVFGLRVIRDGGYPLTFVASAIRNLLRLADFGIFPFSGAPMVLLGLPGLLTIFLSPRYKRIGDYAAGTLVIVEQKRSPFGSRSAEAILSPSAAALLPLVRNLDRLTPDDYRVLRRFVARRQELDISVQAALGEKIARSMLTRLEIDLPVRYQLQYADFLEALERRYAQEQGVL